MTTRQLRHLISKQQKNLQIFNWTLPDERLKKVNKLIQIQNNFFN
jgi:hypothetical protein